MSAASRLERVGLSTDGTANTRPGWIAVALGLALYALGYAAFYPHDPTVDDEDQYLEQTLLWVETGSTFWRDDAAGNEEFITRLDAGEPLVDLRGSATDRLRIWRVGEPQALAPS